MSRLRVGQPRVSPAEALALVPRICDALQFAHEEGVLHRDIKPENILLDTKGRLKIADFGIAKIIGGRPADVGLTETGVAVGTPHYMAPEQLERPQDVDQRADIYSLGVLFYEMLTGELPVGRFEPPSEKAAVDPRVDEVVLRALEKQREKRYASAGEVRTRVESFRGTPSPVSASSAATASTGLPGAEPSGPHGTRRLGAAPPPLSAEPPPGPAYAAPAFSSGPSQPWSRKAIVAAACDAGALLPAIFGLMLFPFPMLAKARHPCGSRS